MAQIDVDRLINAFPPGNYSAGKWDIRIDGARRAITPDGTFALIVWGEITDSTRTLTFTQANPLIWTGAKGGATTTEARALFAAMLDRL
jgi:hypothetical protein